MAELKYQLKKFGPLTERRDYSKTTNDLATPDLLEVQRKSFNELLDKGLEKSIQTIYPITSTSGKTTIHFLYKTLGFVTPVDQRKDKEKRLALAKKKNNSKTALKFSNEIEQMPKNEYGWLKQHKQKGSTYEAKIKAVLLRINEENPSDSNLEQLKDVELDKMLDKTQTKIRIANHETGEIIETIDVALLIKNADDLTKDAKSKAEAKKAKNFGIVANEVLFGAIPLMTEGGTFLINGSEKVIVSQLIRSPGAYYGLRVRNQQGGDDLFNKLEILPQLGSWIEIFHRVTGNSIDWVKIRLDKNKRVPISVFLRAMGMTKETMTELYGESQVLFNTFAKDKFTTEQEALEGLHRVIRKGDRITEESKKNLISNLLFNDKRYNLSRTGRYMLNRKLNLVERLRNSILAENIVSSNGVVLYKAGTSITNEMAIEIQRAYNSGMIETVEIPNITSEVYGSQINENKELEKRTKMALVKVYPTKKWMDAGKPMINVIANDPKTVETHIVVSDLVAAISYYFNIIEGLGNDDDADSLINKRIVNVGELLENQFKIGLTKMEKNAKERMSSKEVDKITPKNITNNKPIYNQFKAFFNSSQLSQFMDQINPLAEISNKRRITSLGPGGLNRDTAQFDVRDVHPTHYGRICPIETPEGPNIGLILNFANYSRINDLGFVETPYFPVKNGVVVTTPTYLSAVEEKGKSFAQSTVTLDAEGRITDETVTVRKNHNYTIIPGSEVDYIDVSSKQVSSIAAACIPFLENDDANRTLMGANMQRQAVPLLRAEAPYVATGIESEIARYSAMNVKASKDGEVTFVDSTEIKVKHGSKTETYNLRTFERSNQGTVISQKPIVHVGQKVKAGDILTDGSSFDNGELSIGKNVLVAFSTWNGFNYEDAVILSERLVKEDVYTSLHIEEYSLQFRKSKAGDDELTTELPNVSSNAKRFLDERGIVTVGSDVSAGDILVGRISPKGEENSTPEEKLIAAIFSQRSKNLRDTSLKVKHGQGGTVINVEILSRDTGDKLEDGVDKIVKVYIAQKRKIKVGDKMAGRHGNKGVISRVLPVEDMPHLPDGTPLDIMLNPLGVPSRMNIGQVLELHLGMAARELGVKFVSPIFDGIKFDDINAALEEAKLPTTGKFKLTDPMTGKQFDNEVSVGVMYMLKLSHMIDDKMHARSVGPYSLITQQPLGGKSQNGGQRFGEMETWAIESYGATNILQELLTYKSDNIDGRNRVYNALATGTPVPKAGMPESFNVLAYELRGLGLKLEVEIDDEKQQQEESTEGEEE
ncbi:DNA-directed RNA polymerase subunit beta [Mycoplasma todarodis]|uniref:DNA-directed RNA polymerase subunit beta n=1 Tax=Mycoplasma todarodis TaxID=1937191 RepID=UPI003B2FD31E